MSTTPDFNAAPCHGFDGGQGASAQGRSLWYVVSTVEAEFGQQPKTVHNVFKREGSYELIAECASEEHARLIAAAPELLAALQWREQFEPRAGEGVNERFERVAETFHRETGYLRPGKDCVVQPAEVRQQAWDQWMDAGRARVRAAIAAATGSAS